jgi:hypothetical protein
VPKVVFVPLTDDLLYEHPERIVGPIAAFNSLHRVEGKGVEQGSAQLHDQQTGPISRSTGTSGVGENTERA